MTRYACIPLFILVMASNPLLRAQTPPNRWQAIDGQPRLIIGMYEQITNDALLVDLAQAGFNLVNTKDDPENLDRLHRHNLYAWVTLGGDLALPAPGEDDGHRDALSARVNRVKNHPAMLVWEGPDEPLWNVWYRRLNQYWRVRDALADHLAHLEGDARVQMQRLLEQSNDLHNRGHHDQADALLASLWKRLDESAPEKTTSWTDTRQDAYALGDALTRGFQLIGQLHPNGIRWINHAPRNSLAALRHYNRAVDMAGCDIYPVPFNPPSGHSDLVDQQLSSVGAYTQRMAAAAPGKSVAMILQGFAWKDLGQEHEGGEARPTFQQTRFMAYDALMNGAAAVIWWGTAYIPKDSQLWHDILATAKELRALELAWTAAPIGDALQSKAEETWGSHDGQGPALRLSRVGDDYVLIASNATRHGLVFRVEGIPRDLEGRNFYRLGTDESHVVTDGMIRDGIQSFESHVYATSRRFETR